MNKISTKNIKGDKNNKNKLEKLKNIFDRYKVYIFCLIVIVLSIISIITQMIDRKSSMIVNSSEIRGKEDKIAVYVTGAVKNPGVYYLPENSRLNNLLDICGGIEENADISQINLAKRLVDSDKITIPVKQEKINNIYENIEEESVEIENETEQIIEVDEKKININTASKEKLMTLEGIGEVTAEKILEYRKKQEFLEIEDIMNVPGIGMSKYDKIKDDITTN